MHNLDLSFHNNSNNTTTARVSQVFNTNLVDSADEYELAINKFNIPLSTLNILEISDNTDWSISLSVDNVHTASASGYKTSATEYLPLSLEYPIRSPSDFVMVVNKTFNKCHKSLLNTDYASFIDTVVGSGVLYQTPATLANNVAVSISNVDKTYATELTISNYVQNSITGSEPDLVNVYLESPSGSQCLVAKSILLPSLGTVTFKDDSLNSSYGVTNLTLDDYSPVDSFQRFKDDDPNGNWVLRITPCGENSLDIDVDYSLKIYGQPKHASDNNRYRFNTQAPCISLKDGYFSLLVEELFLHMGIRITYGSQLAAILSLEKVASSNGLLSIPPITLSSSLDQIITFKAEIAKLYQLTTIDRILISSNSIPVQKDLQIGDVNSNAISSFIIDGSQIEDASHAIFSFEGGMSNHKRYSLLGNLPIRSVDITVQIQRRDGSISNLLLGPHESMSLVLTLYKKN